MLWYGFSLIWQIPWMLRVFFFVRAVPSFPSGKDDIFRSALQKDTLNYLQLTAVPKFSRAEPPAKESWV